MKEILNNLALFDLINYCKESHIDCSGTHLYKYPRKFIYSLLKDETGQAVATVSFSKMSVPNYYN